MDTLRIGIIGIGNMGSAHMHSIADGHIEHARLTAVCDILPQRLAAAAAEFPSLYCFDNADKLLQSGLVDAVIIATEHYKHPPLAIAAFKRHLHVLTEKPAGVYTSAVRQMNQAAKDSGCVFGIMFNQRTNPLFVKAHELVQSGELGSKKRLVWIVTNWYRTQSYYNSGVWRATWSGEGGGVLLNQAPHNLDIWQWIFGMPKTVRGFCRTAQYHDIQVEDDATIYAEYENGATASFITSTGECPGSNRLEISGDLGKIVLEEGRLRHYKLAEHERDFCYNSSESFYQPPVEYSEYSPKDEGSAHEKILQNFVNAALYGEQLIAPGCEGINELTLSNAAYLSSWQDKTVTLPFDERTFEQLLNNRAQTEKKKDAESHIPDGNYSSRWNVRW